MTEGKTNTLSTNSWSSLDEARMDFLARSISSKEAPSDTPRSFSAFSIDISKDADESSALDPADGGPPETTIRRAILFLSGEDTAPQLRFLLVWKEENLDPAMAGEIDAVDVAADVLSEKTSAISDFPEMSWCFWWIWFVIYVTTPLLCLHEIPKIMRDNDILFCVVVSLSPESWTVVLCNIRNNVSGWKWA